MFTPSLNGPTRDRDSAGISQMTGVILTRVMYIKSRDRLYNLLDDAGGDPTLEFCIFWCICENNVCSDDVFFALCDDRFTIRKSLVQDHRHTYIFFIFFTSDYFEND